MSVTGRRQAPLPTLRVPKELQVFGRYSRRGGWLFVIGQESHIKRQSSWLPFHIHP